MHSYPNFLCVCWSLQRHPLVSSFFYTNYRANSSFNSSFPVYHYSLHLNYGESLFLSYSSSGTGLLKQSRNLEGIKVVRGILRHVATVQYAPSLVLSQDIFPSRLPQEPTIVIRNMKDTSGLAGCSVSSRYNPTSNKFWQATGILSARTSEISITLMLRCWLTVRMSDVDFFLCFVA